MPAGGTPLESLMSSYDVLIAGLGPTGATLAALLGQSGLRVAVFDRLPDLYPLPRAIGLDHEALRIMQTLGLGERITPCIAPYRPSEYRGMDGGLIKRLDMAPEPHPLGWAPNYVFNQPMFETLLRQRLSELPTVDAFLEADVQVTGQDATSAWADVLLKGQDTPTRFSGSHLVACDGGASPIRKRLGITLEDLDFDEHWLVVDALVSADKLAELPQTQVQYCEAARPSTFVVGPGNHRRWEILLLDGDSLSPDDPEEELWPLLSRWIRPGEAQLWRAAAYLPLPRPGRTRVAAGPHPAGRGCRAHDAALHGPGHGQRPARCAEPGLEAGARGDRPLQRPAAGQLHAGT